MVKGDLTVLLGVSAQSSLGFIQNGPKGAEEDHIRRHSWQLRVEN